MTLTLGAAAAAAGSASDPLIALNWLRDMWMPQVITQAEEELDRQIEEWSHSTISNSAALGEELCVKRGDVLTLESGSGIVILAGDVTASSTGTLVDVTTGEAVALRSGETLSKRHRYLTAERTTGKFTVLSDTAVLQAAGVYALEPSGELDYVELADALYAMGLLRGTDTPYGNGYDLERTPTRIEGLVMFVRLLGEETKALQYRGGKTEFADVPDWAESYVAYAYDKGYTKGIEHDAHDRVWFGTEETLTSVEYVTFLLRALGYKEGSDFQSWSTAVSDAVALKVLTSGEQVWLEEHSFLRAQTVYLSYYGLFGPVKGEKQTLLETLVKREAVEDEVAEAALADVLGERL